MEVQATTHQPIVCVGTQQFSDDDVQLAFGERHDGRIVHISEVDSGLACGCICPVCTERLEAHRGSQKAHHFHHHRRTRCRSASETLLHKFAKQALDEERRLLIPEVRPRYGTQSVLKHHAREHAFDDAVLENRLGNIVPDVIVRKDGHELLVEMFVTHECDEEKIARIRARGISAIEIDLSGLSRTSSKADIVDAIVRTAPRRWLFNPRIDDAVQEMKATLARAEARRIAEKQRRVTTFVDAIARAQTEQATQRPSATPTAKRVRDDGYGSLIGLKIAGDYCFRVHRTHWQAVILEKFVLSAARFDPSSWFHTPGVLDELRKANLLHPEFAGFIDDELEQSIRARHPDFQCPYKVIEAYLRTLRTRDILSGGGHYWAISIRVQQESEARRRQAEERASRVTHVATLIRKLVAKLPLDEQNGFDPDTWMDRNHPEFGHSPRSCIEEGSAHYSEIWQALSAIEAMLFFRGKIVDRFLGLPLENERRRQIEQRLRIEEEQRRAKEEADARAIENRARQIAECAAGYLGPDSNTWTEVPSRWLSERAPIEVARESDQGLEKARSAVVAEHREREAAKRRELKAEECRGRLADIVGRAMKSELAALFLRAGHPRLGGKSPTDYCRDDATLAICLTLLPTARRKR